LFLFNGASREILREAELQKVRVHFLWDYSEFLQRAHARGSVLAIYPTFHKFLVLPELVSPNLPAPSLTQLLYLDCDTFFFDDVNFLFDRHSEKHLYAREEPSSRRSPHGYNPNHIDELLLKEIAGREGLRSVEPFNSGVCLMNHGVWQSLIGLRGRYLDLAWRLLCGWEAATNPHAALAHSAQELLLRQAVRDAVTDLDRSRALPYPSENYWIVEQIALWLALGALSDFSLGTLPAEQVPQGGEFEGALQSRQRCVLAHYFSGSEQKFFSLVSAVAA
jgi:hypothetical protein